MDISVSSLVSGFRNTGWLDRTTTCPPPSKGTSVCVGVGGSSRAG